MNRSSASLDAMFSPEKDLQVDDIYNRRWTTRGRAINEPDV